MGEIIMHRQVPLSLAFLGTVVFAAPVVAQPPQAGFGFNGSVSGFPTGAVSVTGGGAYELSSGFVHAAGGFSCIDSVHQGPLSNSVNQNDPGPCLTGQGVRWDTAAVLPSTMFSCTGRDTPKLATTSDTLVVLEADFYRDGDANNASFRAQMMVSATDIAPGNDFPGLQNLWVQGVGCGTANVNFSNK